jgi:hypothetical protein
MTYKDFAPTELITISRRSRQLRSSQIFIAIAKATSSARSEIEVFPIRCRSSGAGRSFRLLL